jgi:hypothetical protein
MRIRDPGWKKYGSGMEKIRIRDKHSESATQTNAKNIIFYFITYLTVVLGILSKQVPYLCFLVTYLTGYPYLYETLIS